MLLKGCYKMAMNKYLSLIKMGADGFAQREWSVINLNLGIAYQFQSRLEDAIAQIVTAIDIDPHYEKAYYRKIQILYEMGKYELALSSPIPQFIKNQEIDDLLVLQKSFRAPFGNSSKVHLDYSSS